MDCRSLERRFRWTVAVSIFRPFKTWQLESLLDHGQGHGLCRLALRTAVGVCHIPHSIALGSVMRMYGLVVRTPRRERLVEAMGGYGNAAAWRSPSSSDLDILNEI